MAGPANDVRSQGPSGRCADGPTSLLLVQFRTPSPPPNDVCANRPQPYQGLYARHEQHPDVAPLTLRTASGSNYVVKINEAASGRPVLSLFLYGGSSFEIQVPRGAFVLKYATGNMWCVIANCSVLQPKRIRPIGSFNSTMSTNIQLN